MNQNSRPPKYCRKRSKDRADRAYVRLHGKMVMLGRYGSEASKAKYAALVGDLPATVESAGSPVERRISVTELLAGYLEYVTEYWGPNTPRSSQIKSFMRLLRQHFGELPADEFRAKRLKALREHFIAASWGREYINAQVNRVRRMFRWAASEEMISADVLASLESVEHLKAGHTRAPDPESVLPVPDEVVAATLPYLSEMVATMVQVQRLCGCRPGELVRVRKGDIDRRGKVWVAKLKKHKTAHRGKQRAIHFGPRVQQLLLPYLACGDEDRIFAMRRDDYSKAVRRAAQKAGVPHWFPMQLRHASGTTVREEFGLEYAQVHLGHSNAQITQVYAETHGQKAAEVALKLG